MFFNKEERHNPSIHITFVSKIEGFRYLGVTITPELSNIISANYDPLLERVTDALNRSSTLPI